MIVRLVSLRFHPDRVEEFKQLYQKIHRQIRSSPGCLHLQLVVDNEGEGECFTISYWRSQEDLDRYRSSPFFRSIWPRVKAMLREKPWAKSFEILVDDPFRPVGFGDAPS